MLAIIIISRRNIASHTNGIKLSFGRFLKSKWTVQKEEEEGEGGGGEGEEYDNFR